MPLTAFIDFLQSKELHFASANSFEDSLEGQVGFDVMLKEIGIESSELETRIIKKLKNDSYLSCWHLSEAESLAMWRLYGKSNSSIALVSSVGKVMSVGHDFCQDLNFVGMFGEVVYENYVMDGKLNVTTLGLPFGYGELPLPKGLLTFFIKAPAFQYEKEWRMVMHKKSSDLSAFRVPVVDLESFVKKVYVSPESPDWVVMSVARLVQVQFGFRGIPVERSPLSAHFRI